VLVTDVGEFRVRNRSHAELRLNLGTCVRHVEGAADEIRAALWPGAEPLPVWNPPARKLAAVKVVAAAVEGTVTAGGQIAPSVLAMFERLRDSGRQVVLVTGRSAGWGAALARYLPGVSGVVAENGAVLIPAGAGETAPVILDEAILDGSAPTAAALEECLAAVLEKYPDARPGSDNYCRVSDRTVQAGDGIDPEGVRRIADGYGLTCTSGTAHHHLSRSSLDKKTGLLLALARYLSPGTDAATQVVTVGDAANDAVLFEPGAFAAAFGVRCAVPPSTAPGTQAPQYMALADGGTGFGEIAALLLQARD